MLFFVIIIIFAIIIFINSSREDFATKREKTLTIKSWFDNNVYPTYTQYKKDMGKKSNVVEYEDILKLYQNNRNTIMDIENII